LNAEIRYCEQQNIKNMPSKLKFQTQTQIRGAESDVRGEIMQEFRPPVCMCASQMRQQAGQGSFPTTQIGGSVCVLGKVVANNNNNNNNNKNTAMTKRSKRLL
jgi:hypothetical protein